MKLFRVITVIFCLWRLLAAILVWSLAWLFFAPGLVDHNEERKS